MQVLDASVIYKWYVDEKGSEIALEYLNNLKESTSKISVPDLILYELANAFRFNRKNTEKDVENVIDNFVKLGLDIVITTTSLLKDAIKISYKYNLTVYDAVYVSLSKDLGFEFITADRKLFNKINTLNFVKFLYSK